MVDANPSAKIGFDENLLCQTSGWCNNCGLNCLTHFLYSKLESGQLETNFENDLEYKKLLLTFQQYYNLPAQPSPTWDDVKAILEPLGPLDREMVFAPVLRKHLEKVLLANAEELWEKDGTAALSVYLNNIPEADSTIITTNTKYFSELKVKFKLELKAVQVSITTPAELEAAKKSIIASNSSNADQEKNQDPEDKALQESKSKILKEQSLDLKTMAAAKKYWLSTGCAAYAKHVGKLSKAFMVTADQLQLLCRNLDINAEVYTPQSPKSQNIQEAWELQLSLPNSAAAKKGYIYLKKKDGMLECTFLNKQNEIKVVNIPLSEVDQNKSLDFILGNNKKRILQDIKKQGHDLPDFPWTMKVLNSGIHWEYEEPDGNLEKAQQHNAAYKKESAQELTGSKDALSNEDLKILLASQSQKVNKTIDLSTQITDMISTVRASWKTLKGIATPPPPTYGDLRIQSEAAMNILLDRLNTVVLAGEPTLDQTQKNNIIDSYFEDFSKALLPKDQKKPTDPTAQVLIDEINTIPTSGEIPEAVLKRCGIKKP